jgi:YbbR domain-containing protein
VDATALRAGTHEIDLSMRPVEGLPPSVEVLGLTPATWTVSLDERVTRKVGVDVATVGVPDEGTRVREATADPVLVELSGPRVVVSALKRALTLPVDVSGLTADTSVVVGLDLPRTVVVEPAQVRVSVDVEPRADRRGLAAIPLEVRGHPDWVPAIDIVDVVLEGPSQVLAGVRPDDVLVVAVLPDPPRRDRYVASFGEDEGARLVVFVRDAPEVRAVEVVPGEVEVVGP